MRTRTALATLLAAALPLSLAACSGDGGVDAAAQQPTDKLEVMSWWTSESEHPALETLYQAFTAAHPGVTITDGAVAGGGGSNVQVVLASRLQAGDPPDVWQTFAGASLDAFERSGRISDVSGVYTSSGLGTAMVPAVLDSVTLDGKQWGVPTGSHRENVLFVNPALLEKAGQQAPDPATGYTLKDWQAQLDAVQEAGVTPLCLGGKDAFASAGLFESYLLATVGPTGWADIQADKFDWNGASAAAALDGFGVALDHADPDAGALTWDEATAKFGSGGCAFMVFNDSAYGELVADGKVDGTDFIVTTFPDTQDSYLAVLDTFVLGTGVANPRNGYDFLSVVADPATSAAFNKEKGSVPVRTDVDMAGFSPYQQEAQKALVKGPVLLSITHGEVGSPAFQQGFYDAVSNYRTNRDHDAFVRVLTDAVNQVPAPAP